MIGIFGKLLRERAAEWHVPEEGEWRFIYRNSYDVQESAATSGLFMTLWFHESDRYPRVICKVARSRQVIEREWNNSLSIHSIAPSYVPRPLYFATDEAYSLLCIEGVQGHHIEAPRYFSGSSNNLDRLVEVVASIHRLLETQSKKSDSQRFGNLVAEPISGVASFGQSSKVRNGCAELAEMVSSQVFEQLPVIPQHGDLHLGNIITYRDKMYVVDWQNLGAIDLPFFDLFTLSLSILGGTSPNDWSASAARKIPSLVEKYFRRLKLPVGMVRLLLPLALVNWFYLEWPGLQRRTKRFKQEAYSVVDHYYEHKGLWEQIFLPE